MTMSFSRLAALVAAVVPFLIPTTAAEAQTTVPRKPAAGAQPAQPARPARKAAAPPKPVEPPPPAEADAEQLETAEKVYYGVYECEFKQSVDIVASPRYKGYVDVKLAKSLWLMKPVLSSTGAIRLEDVRGETLMVQISAKSMLLNVKTGHRLVDDCISARQRELIEAARLAKAQAAAASAAASASAAPASAASAAPASAAASSVPPAPASAPAAPPAPASAASGVMTLPTPVTPSSSAAR